jgi:hypothetical protein
MPELVEAEEAGLRVQLEQVVENRTKNMLRAVLGVLEKSTSISQQGAGVTFA